jgi:uncharacterized protein (TIGR03086 family)
MTPNRELSAPSDGLELLKLSLDYALAVSQHVTAERFAHPTPCSRWDLGTLLLHVNDSLEILQEGIDAGCVGVVPPDEQPIPLSDLLSTFRSRACRLVRTCATARAEGSVRVADAPFPVSVMAATGALEMAVHGWDVAQACASPYRVPDDLALRLLDLAPWVVDDATRGSLFAPPVATPSNRPGDRLVAQLGRGPAGFSRSRG